MLEKKHDSQKNSEVVNIDGTNLTPEKIWRIIKRKNKSIISLSNNLDAVDRSYAILQKMAEKKIIYGVNTGFGPMASHVMGKSDLITLQRNLVRSHASGAGKPLSDEYVLATMVVRLNTLAMGYSGVSPELLKRLTLYINNQIIPIVPEHGAVGTSGDLIQLAHIALALIGEGEVRYMGKLQNTSDVLKKLGIAPYTLKIKEGISLINGTSFMTGIAALLLQDIERQYNIAIHIGALALEVTSAYDDSIAEKLHIKRPHKGQGEVARRMRTLLSDSKRLTARYVNKEATIKNEAYRLPCVIQDVYSFRCIPQVLGPLYDSLLYAKEIITTEINSATDNPLIDIDEEIFLHGGNFHGDYIAVTLDQLKIPLIKMTLMSERRTNFFLDEKINKTFPPFLNSNRPGLTLALQGLQFTATSTVAQNQTLAFPHSVHSISTNGANQDIVSMGTDAALFLHKVVENSYIILAIELITLLQAMDITGDHEHYSSKGRLLYENVRTFSKTIHEDRPLTADIEKCVEFMKSWKGWDE